MISITVVSQILKMGILSLILQNLLISINLNMNKNKSIQYKIKKFLTNNK